MRGSLPMDRLLMSQLAAWKQKQKRKPLIIHGARQVGKTWLMKEFGRRYFKQFQWKIFRSAAEILFYRRYAGGGAGLYRQ